MQHTAEDTDTRIRSQLCASGLVELKRLAFYYITSYSCCQKDKTQCSFAKLFPCQYNEHKLD